jgi:signal transduction histidine kinase
LTKPGLAALERVRRVAREQLGRTAIAYAVLAVALILTGLAYVYVRHNVEERQSAQFEETAQATKRAVDRRMDTYIDATLDGRGLFAASRNVTRVEWSSYVAGSELERRYPGIQAIAYAEHVPLGAKKSYVNRVRDEGLSSFELRPSGERYEYFPLTYVAPPDKANMPLLGYDVYSDRVSRDAMEQARDTGLPRASGKVDLGKAGISRQSGFLVYTPVYRHGAPQATPDERRAALQGFIVSVFRTDKLLGGIFGARAGPQMDFEIFDGAEFTRERLLHDDDGVLHAGDPSYQPRFEETTTLEVAGRIWSLYFSTPPGFEPGWRSNLPLFVLLSGLAISLMLFGITWVLSNNRIHAERVGLELEAANEDLENANRDLEETNRELEGANRELEAFSYSVSHDLRAPLRSIEGFSQILLEDYVTHLDEEGRGYLGRVRAASRRMALLIDDLLDLSRVTRTEMRRQTVDLSAIARDIAEELRKSDPDREVEFEIEDGLVVGGDARLLRVALWNLLENAWKFTEKEPDPKIAFASTLREGRRVYCVTDNGAGFDARYSDKLFGAFQRLHPSEEFEGTGIGLATVARIVHRHGGEVWATGGVGEGAAFFFTLR